MKTRPFQLFIAVLPMVLIIAATAHPVLAGTFTLCSDNFDGSPGTGSYPVWTSMTVLAGTGSATTSNPLKGGNPNGYQNTVFAGAGGQWEILLIDPQCTYTPSTQGAITNITMRFDAQSSNTIGATQYWPAIVQGGNIYRAIVAYNGTTTWTPFSTSGTGNFCLNAGCGSGPNFSTGTTMTFGYLIFTNTNGSVALGVDNYSVSITNNNSAGLSCNMLTTPNLVDNPGFETGTVGSTTIPSWTVAWTDPFFQIAITPHGGLQSLAMGSIPGANRVTQTIPTVAGQEYMVCFWLLNGTPSADSSFQAQWNGFDMVQMVNNATFGYQLFAFLALGTGNCGGSASGSSCSGDVLTFQARQVPNFYYLDDVSVQLCSTGSICDPQSAAPPAGATNAVVTSQITKRP